MHVERLQQAAVRDCSLVDAAPGGLQAAFCSVEVARFREQVTQQQQALRGEPVSGGCGVIAVALGALDQLLVVVAREKEAAGGRVFELLDKHIRELAGPMQPLGIPPRLQQFIKA